MALLTIKNQKVLKQKKIFVFRKNFKHYFSNKISIILSLLILPIILLLLSITLILPSLFNIFSDTLIIFSLLG